MGNYKALAAVSKAARRLDKMPQRSYTLTQVGPPQGIRAARSALLAEEQRLKLQKHPDARG